MIQTAFVAFVASCADVLLARHTFLGEKRLRDEPKERMRRRLLQKSLHIISA